MGHDVTAKQVEELVARIARLEERVAGLEAAHGVERIERIERVR
jgi:hypothetical protein